MKYILVVILLVVPAIVSAANTKIYMFDKYIVLPDKCVYITGKNSDGSESHFTCINAPSITNVRFLDYNPDFLSELERDKDFSKVVSKQYGNLLVIRFQNTTQNPVQYSATICDYERCIYFLTTDSTYIENLLREF